MQSGKSGRTDSEVASCFGNPPYLSRSARYLSVVRAPQLGGQNPPNKIDDLVLANERR